MDPGKDERQNQNSSKRQLATLGGGCFWCLEPIFKNLVGVEEVRVGYSGGVVRNPSYREVCTGTTGHAEVIQISFDPREISFKEILEVFFASHDPTTLNRQGADVGPQYRSAIFYHGDDQKKVAEEMIRELDEGKTYPARMITEIVPFTAFYKAEEYHQGYFEKNPDQPYCRVIIEPKVAKFQKRYSSKLKHPRFA